MDVNSIQARIRPRRPWEAVDLGFMMVWAWRGAVYGPWVAACLPVLVLVAVLGYSHPFLASLLLWWLKPLLDRVLLHTLSRALFREMPGWRAIVRELPRLWGRGLLRAFLVHRFDFARSFTMPVELLEGLRGRVRKARLRVLGRRQKEEAVRLSVVCWCAELSLTLSVAMLVAYLLPSRVITDPVIESIRPPFVEESSRDLSLLGYLLLGSQMLAVLFMEPFYQAGGLCLYLNRRTELEAWDVEVAFRRIGARWRGWAGTAAAVAIVTMLSVLCLSPRALAADDQAPPSSDSLPCLLPNCLEAHKAIADVLSDPVFGSTRHVTSWRLRPKGPSDASSRGSWLLSVGAALGSALEPLLWAAALLCLMTFIVMRQRIPDQALLTGLRERQPSVVLGMDVRRASLPDDVAGEARRLMASGRSDEAVGLLLRGALASLAVRERLPLRRSMTEGECVSLVRRALPGVRADYFQSLTAVWSSAAYGHRMPASSRLAEMIDGWSLHFQERS